jgi:hypothetical protein
MNSGGLPRGLWYRTEKTTLALQVVLARGARREARGARGGGTCVDERHGERITPVFVKKTREKSESR